MKRSHFTTLSLLALSLTAASLAATWEAPTNRSMSHGSAPATPTPFNLTATSTGYSGPSTVQAGYVAVDLSNTSKMPVDAAFFRLRPGVSEAQFRAALSATALHSVKNADYKLAQMADVLGGPGTTGPGGHASAVVHLTPGRYLLSSGSSDFGGHNSLMSLGYYKAVTVTGPELNNAPSMADYTSKMLDFRFELPASVAAGTHTWHLSNEGKEAHFMLVAKLLPGKTIKDVMAAMMSSTGPPPVDFQHAQGSQALTAGQAQNFSLDLSTGHYAVVCFIGSKDGTEHAAMGMLQELVVQ